MSDQLLWPTLAPKGRQGEIVMEERTMRWFRSDNGVWCVCASDKEAPACACALTVQGAVRQWERAKEIGE